MQVSCLNCMQIVKTALITCVLHNTKFFHNFGPVEWPILCTQTVVLFFILEVHCSLLIHSI